MKTINYKQLGTYILVGIISGCLCTGIAEWRLFPKIVNEQIPAIILTIVMVVVVRYVSKIQFRSGWLSPIALTAACLIGWNLAIEFGSDYYRTDWYVVISGTIGGVFVAIGVSLTWPLSRPVPVVIIITSSGLVGGIILFLVGLAGYLETLGLFVIWQSILLLGICISIQIYSTQLSK